MAMRFAGFLLSALSAAVLAPPCALAAGPAAIAGNPARGEQLFTGDHCVTCHAVNGKGGRVGIDLGRAASRNFTPAQLACNMWNRAPVMWVAMDARGIEPPRLSPEDAADLFAFLYSSRLIGQPESASPAGGSALRGKKIFATRRCSACHAEGHNGAPQLPGQARSYSAVTLMSVLWRHGPAMLRRMKQAGIAWPTFRDPQELTDLIAYLNVVQ